MKFPGSQSFDSHSDRSYAQDAPQFGRLPGPESLTLINRLENIKLKKMEIDVKRHRSRKFRNYLLQPGRQLRYVILISIWGVLSLSYIQGIVIYTLGKFAIQYAQRLDLPYAEVQFSMKTAWWFFGISVFLNCLMAAGFGIYISHRFLGPARAIRNALQELKTGNFSHRKQLRKGDEMMDVMFEVNALAEVLDSKYSQPTQSTT
jgi:hypothetical protein